MYTKKIAWVATLLGLIRYYPQYLQVQSDVSSFSKQSVILSIIIGVLWALYNRLTSRDNVFFFSIMIGIIFQLYVLTKIVEYKKTKMQNV